MTRKRILPAVLAVMLLVCAGCITFDHQTVVIVYSPATDEATLLLVYEGIHADHDTDTALDESKKQLGKFVSSNKEFCLGDNWPFHFDLAEGTPAENGKPAAPNPLAEFLTITNRGIFLNQNDRLCGWQTVSIHPVRAFLKAQNKAFSKMIAETVAGNRTGKSDDIDEATLKALEKAAREDFPWFDITHGRIEFTVFASPAQISKSKRELLYAAFNKELLAKIVSTNGAPVSESARAELQTAFEDYHKGASFIADNPWSIDQGPDRVKISLGVGGDQPIRMRFRDDKRESGAYEKEITEFVKGLGLPFKEKDNTEDVVAAFIKARP